MIYSPTNAAWCAFPSAGARAKGTHARDLVLVQDLARSVCDFAEEPRLCLDEHMQIHRPARP